MPDAEAALQPFGPEIWLADGPAVESAGFAYPTRMAVIRLAGDRLWLWSPVALTPALHAAVAALGEVAWLVAPNRLHHLFFADWHRAFPAARSFAAPGLAGRRRDLSFDAELGDAPPPEWRGEIEQTAFANHLATELICFHRGSGTLLVADLIQHFPPGWFRGWRAVVARLDRMSAPRPQVPRKFRLATADRDAARATVARLRGWPIRNLVMAHGAPVRGEGAAAVSHAFAWLD